MLLTPLALDTHRLGSGTDYEARFLGANGYPVTVTLDMTQRRSTWSVFNQLSIDGRTLTLDISLLNGAATSAATFNRNIKDWFDPTESATLRYLMVTGDDGRTQLRIGVYVTALEPKHGWANAYVATLVAPKPYFESPALTPSGNNPASVVNGGNVAVHPTLTLTTTRTATWQHWTVTGAGTGGGLRQFPVKLAVSDANLTVSNAYAYVNGVPVPFTVYAGGTGGSYVWIRVDTASDGTTATVIDLLYGAALTGNPLCGALLDNGLDWANPATLTNLWQWNNISVSSNASLPGCWHPAVTGSAGGVSGSYGITTDTSSSVVINRYTNDTGANDADSIVLELGGVLAGGLNNVWRTTINHSAPTATIATTVNGGGGSDEQQTITLAHTVGGTFALTFSGQTTSPINWNASTRDVQSALEGLSNIGVGQVLVSGGPLPGALMTVRFTGTLANTNVAQMTVDATYLQGAGAQSYVKYKTSNNLRDTYAWTQVADATGVTGSIAVTNAVQIAIGLEYTTATPQQATLSLSFAAGPVDWSLSLTNTPTVTLVSTSTVDVYDGVATIGGTSLTFKQFMASSGTLTITEDEHGWDIVSSAGGYRFFGPADRLSWSNPDQWLVLTPGTNATSHTLTGATMALSWRMGVS